MIDWKRPSTFELFYLILTFCGFVAIVVSLFFLTRQTRLLTHQTELLAQSARRDTYAAITNNLTVTKQIFIEHPHLRPYFYNGVSISEGDDHYLQAESVAEHLLDFFDGILLQSEKARFWDDALWEKYFRDSFRSSPILCAYLVKNHIWYTPRLSQLMQEAVPGLTKTLAAEKSPQGTGARVDGDKQPVTRTPPRG